MSYGRKAEQPVLGKAYVPVRITKLADPGEVKGFEQLYNAIAKGKDSITKVFHWKSSNVHGNTC